MKTLVSLCGATLLFTACGSPGPTPDAGKLVTLKFAAGTPLTVQSPADDAAPATAGFQYDVVVEPKNGDTGGSVVFRLNDVPKATVPFENGKATARLTFNVGPAGTKSENLVTAERVGGDDVAIAWLFSVQNN